MKKIGLIIAVLVLLQVVFVTSALADGPYQGGGDHHGYYHGGYQYSHHSYYPRYYPKYNYNYHYYHQWNNNYYPRYNYRAWYGCNPCCRPTYYGYQRTHYWY